VLADAERQQLMPREKAVNDMLNVIQRGTQSSVASAVNKVAVRLAAGSDRLAELVRRDQDLATEAEALDKSIVAAVSKDARSATRPPSSAPAPGLPLSRPSGRHCKRPCPPSFPTTPRCRIRCR
jgi:hypothetical protein